MRKTLLLLLVPAFLIGCTSWPAAHDDVVKLQSVFKAYRAHTSPTNPTETATVQAIGDNIEATLANLEQVTK